MSNIYFGNITFKLSGKPQLRPNNSLSYNELRKSDIINFLREAGRELTPGIIEITDSNENTIREYFKENLVYIEAAGGLVQNPAGEILFIFRHGKWDLPKGKPEKGENMEETAMREVEEETGVSGLKIIATLPSTWHIYDLDQQNYAVKRSYWFKMLAKNWKDIQIQTEEDISDAEWIKMPVPDYILDNAFLSIRELVNYFQNHR